MGNLERDTGRKKVKDTNNKFHQEDQPCKASHDEKATDISTNPSTPDTSPTILSIVQVASASSGLVDMQLSIG
jgi:hypothetical protein